jgi:hypothetical protein
MRGLQTAGLLDGPARAALQAALDKVAALQQAHRGEKEAGLPTKVLHDRACRDRDQAVQKLSRTQADLEDTRTQLDALLKRQEMLQARAKEQSTKVEAAAKRVQELGQKLAVETAGVLGASPFTASGPGFSGPPTTSPFKRQRPDEETADDDGMGEPTPPASPIAVDPRGSAGTTTAGLAGRQAAGATPGFVGITG